MSSELGSDQAAINTPPPQAEEQPHHERGRGPRWAYAAAVAGVLAVSLLVPNGDISAATMRQNAASLAPILVQRDRNEDAATFGSFGCSAFVIRDRATQVAVGAVTAEHCGLYNGEDLSTSQTSYGTLWAKSGNGEQYIVKNDGGQNVY